jgi:hypothetical protein
MAQSSFIEDGVEQVVHIPAKAENLHPHFIQLEEDFLVGFIPLYRDLPHHYI